MERGALLIAIVATGCGRVGFAAQPDAGLDVAELPDAALSPDMAAAWTVCPAGCAFSTIQSAVDRAVSDPNPTAQPYVIEIRAGTYLESVHVDPLLSGVAVTLRAATGDTPVISGSGGSNATALTISAPDVRISGFMFVGSAQRAIAVWSPRVTIDHDFFTADFSAWDPDQYFRGTGVLLQGAGTDGAAIVSNTFYDCQESVQILDAPAAGNGMTLRNNIFVQLTESRPDYEPILWFKPSIGYYRVASNYNLFYFTGSECIAWDGSTGPVTTLAAWQSNGLDLQGIGTGIDPLLANPIGREFDERSTSPAIDRGDPADPVGDEPLPNGGIINLGGYGGTAQASRSP